MSKKIPKLDLPGKPKYLKVAEDNDFFELFRKIEKRYSNCFLLESLGEESYVSRYSIIGFDPPTILSAQGKTLTVTDTVGKTSECYERENPYFALREIMPENIISRKYAGGLIGFVSYDSINYFEPTLNIKSNSNFEAFKFGVFLDGLVCDKMTGEVFYFYFKESRFDEIKDIFHEPADQYGELRVVSKGDSLSKEQHCEAVRKVKDDIRNGLVFQCEVGFKSYFEIEGDTLQIYRELRQQNPSPHMYYMKFDDQKLIGASPELLLRLRQGELETFPLAGTVKRGADLSEDILLARKLLNDPKEIAEHSMLVDLHRNDIGRVAKFGSVKVRTLMDIKRYSHVQHISSEIVGLLRDDEDMFSALASNFPAGTLSGAPKVEAMKIIEELEPVGRGPYGGGLGQFSFNGDCTFAIPIRSLFLKGKDAFLQACGGNVYDSCPEGEYLEIQRKLAATKNILESFL